MLKPSRPIRLSLTVAVCRRIYRFYRRKILSRIFNIEVYAPRMRYEEVEIIENLLKCLKPKNILEWGSGYSTLHFPEFISKDAKWRTLEHAKEWFAKINAMNKNNNVSIFLVEPNQLPFSGDGTYSDFKDYIDFSSNLPRADLIIIDGRARKDCLVKAHEILAENGVVVLHDAQRQYYHESFSIYKYQMMLSDYDFKDKMLWIGSKSLDLNKIIDIRNFKQLWGIYRKLGAIEKFKRNIFFRSSIRGNNWTNFRND